MGGDLAAVEIPERRAAAVVVELVGTGAERRDPVDRRCAAVDRLATAGVAGVLIAKAGLGAILAIAPTDVPRLATVALGGSSVMFAMALATKTSDIRGEPPP